jgi:hypothetical protein
MNFWDQPEPFVDRPMGQDEEVTMQDYATPPPVRRSAPAQRAEEVVQEVMSEDEEFEDTEWLTDARLRLEQGRLYELLMNHNMFEGVQADARAIRNVQREIRQYAKERMEIMLGMRQMAAPVQQAQSSVPFNEMELQVLRLLANKASGGKTAEQPAPAREGLAPMVAPPQPPKAVAKPMVAQKPAPLAKAEKPLPKSPQKPIERKKDPIVDRILREEGLTREHLEENYRPLDKDPSQMTEEEKIQRNQEITKRRRLQTKSDSAKPMPSFEQQNAYYSQQAAQVAGGPMSLLLAAVANKNK